MSIEELHFKLSNNNFNNYDIIKVELLLEAINDWPDPIDSLNDFLEKLKINVRNDDVTYSILREASSKLNPKTEAWKMESYSTLIELMHVCDYKSLNEIVFYLENYKNC